MTCRVAAQLKKNKTKLSFIFSLVICNIVIFILFRLFCLERARPRVRGGGGSRSRAAGLLLRGAGARARARRGCVACAGARPIRWPQYKQRNWWVPRPAAPPTAPPPAPPPGPHTSDLWYSADHQAGPWQNVAGAAVQARQWKPGEWGQSQPRPPPQQLSSRPPPPCLSLPASSSSTS